MNKGKQKKRSRLFRLLSIPIQLLFYSFFSRTSFLKIAHFHAFHVLPCFLTLLNIWSSQQFFYFEPCKGSAAFASCEHIGTPDHWRFFQHTLPVLPFFLASLSSFSLVSFLPLSKSPSFPYSLFFLSHF